MRPYLPVMRTPPRVGRWLGFQVLGLQVLCLQGLALGLALGVPGSASAQEIRLAGGMGLSFVDEIGFATGVGAGARFFLPRGVGFALEVDRLKSSPTVFRVTCASTGDDCFEEDVAMETRADFTTLLLMLRGDAGEWGVRLGIGRSAGVVTSEGVSETGRPVTAPPADTGAGALAWNRGADGSVLVIEVHRRLPVPGPFPVRFALGYRLHYVRMKGCAVGELSPFCGNHSLSQLEAGLNLGLWPEGDGDSP